jgi:hypothetical protein
MVESIKKLLFKSVVVVLLLHAFIPHQHRDEMSEKAHLKLHQDNDSLIDILKIVFHEGADEYLDNLFFTENNYKVSAQYFSNQHPNKNGSLAIKNCIEGVQLYRNSDNCIYSNIFIVKLNGLRAPPATLYS